MQHVATWKEGDEKWAYHEDAFKHIATHKVSLDPYRQESRRILTCIKDFLPSSPLQRVEKASVDEVFLDLSAQVHSILLEKFPEISGPAPYDDPTEFLPRPPMTALDWHTDALVDLDSSQTEDDDPDWDDIAMLTASDIVRDIRANIRERLKYTCSAGIGRNKMIAKLGSGHKKPNAQTVVRNRAVHHFLHEFKFTKIRNLGGKLGEEIVSKFATDQVSELLQQSIEHMKSRLGDDTGSWVWHIIRGEDSSEVNARTQIKSMLSAKSFRPTINTSEQAIRWLRIFVADIMSRLIEEGVLEKKRRPKTINLHHRHGGQTRSRQAPIPTGRPIDEALLFDISRNLLGQVVVDGRVWPCSNLQLSVGAFEEGPTGNKGIGGFLLKGEEAKASTHYLRDGSRYVSAADAEQPAKRRKIEDGIIQNFFARPHSSHGESGESDQGDASGLALPYHSDQEDGVSKLYDVSSVGDSGSKTMSADSEGGTSKNRNLIGTDAAKHQSSITTYLCPKCNGSIPNHQRDEHEDWHFAKTLQAQERSVPSPANEPRETSTATSGDVHASAGGRKPGRSKAGGLPPQRNLEKGQKKLAFG